MNFKDYFIVENNDLCYQFDNIGAYDIGILWLGYSETNDDTINTGVRFENIILSQGQTILEAKLNLYGSTRKGTDDIEFIIRGFDEDNTAIFGITTPGGRSKTTESATGSYDYDEADHYVSEDVTAIVQEIVDRNGWSSGNAIGFWIEDNGTSTSQENYIFSTKTTTTAVLSIKLSSDPDVTPSPINIGTPSLPSSNNYGVKISKPGVNVGTASDSDLYFTTDKRVLKVVTEDEIEIGPATWGAEVTVGTVTHNLGYQASWLVYGNKDGKRFKMPRWMGTADDPVAGGPQGLASNLNNSLEIDNAINGTITYYYYIFID